MNIVKALCASLASFLAVYLLGVFYSVSFDISTWEAPVRFGVAMIGGGFAALTFAVRTIK